MPLYHAPLNKKLGELAELVGGKLQGDASYVVNGAATLAEAGPEDVAFLGNAKYAGQAASSQAGCLLLPSSSPDIHAKSKNAIFVEDPQYAFSQVLELIDAVMR